MPSITQTQPIIPEFSQILTFIHNFPLIFSIPPYKRTHKNLMNFKEIFAQCFLRCFISFWTSSMYWICFFCLITNFWDGVRSILGISGIVSYLLSASERQPTISVPDNDLLYCRKKHMLHHALYNAMEVVVLEFWNTMLSAPLVAQTPIMTFS